MTGAVWDPDLEAVDALRALISGDAPFDIADTDEFIEGRVAGLDQASSPSSGAASSPSRATSTCTA